jgi:hypothetical protein
MRALSSRPFCPCKGQPGKLVVISRRVQGHDPAINIDRIVAWLEERPRATTRTSRFAALAPVHDLPAETPAV